MKGVEVNFDGLVGPTHNYSGLSFGNLASIQYGNTVSNPRLAAQQGLKKMKALHDLGVCQGVFAPHERPDIASLRQLGFGGTDANVLAQAAKEAPAILATATSASAMWAANAATVSPSADTADGRVHFTPANLNNHFHRSIEHLATQRLLRAIFVDETRFLVHQALPAQSSFSDEGAANHSRFCGEYAAPGVEFFVFGRSAFDPSYPCPTRFPARQTREATEAVIRRHRLGIERVVIAQQHPDAIDFGVFHNDVIAVGNRHVLFCHEKAFINQPRVLDELGKKMVQLGLPWLSIEVSDNEVSIEETVKSYLFNSQLLSRPDGRMTIVVPQECQRYPNVWAYLQRLTSSGGPIDAIQMFDLTESMRNGGGPACLRLRVALSNEELQAINPGVIMSECLFEQLMSWVDRHYRDRLVPADMADVSLLEECRTALDELTYILRLGSIYSFQMI